ncbi:hypothetical protein [Microbulbifer spongiae]|uniref:Uncharacterized protein n=1 Tax=Microbulbifer spongiae TaxID=2944933 RepID=A0ABY9EAF5_9GAMM|nr:hypothetical protein [Microbulbifer sp. MI-G]WKD48409.1 hypothetical protein M8T91_10750 [Microbulbifer sp. MI-G]
MFKFILRKISAVVIIFCSMEAIAAETITGEIKRLYPDRGKIFFRLKNDTCIAGNQYYYFEMNEEDARGKYAAKNWYSMLLANGMAGKKVTVSVPECPPSGNIEILYLFQEY